MKVRTWGRGGECGSLPEMERTDVQLGIRRCFFVLIVRRTAFLYA